MLRDLLKDCYTQDSPRTIQTLRLATDAEQELKEISDHYTKLLSRKSETEIGLRYKLYIDRHRCLNIK